MYSPCSHSFIAQLGLSGLIALSLPANAAPLPRDAAYPSAEGASERRLSDADLALSDSRLDLLPEAPSVNMQGQILGTGRRSNLPETRGFDDGQFRDPATGQFGGSLRDTMRSFVTVRRANGTAPGVAASRGGNSRQSPDDLGLDLGFTTNEWIQESVQGVMTSVLNLNVNEQGHASFSVLGLGDFSVVISADRSEIAFVSGDDVLAATRRTAYSPQGSSGAYPGGYADSYGAGAAAVSASASESPLRRAIELALEVASHPLSFIVYALIGGYAIVWGILSGRARRPVHAGGHHSTHYESIFHGRPLPVVAPAPKKERKRMRVRVRARKYR